ncbi:MAG: DUF5103 domain-containing protein [Bacteroidota bacterium]|nr:DUF5103 domain-containing protein [Bacteroidota bacterium]
MKRMVFFLLIISKAVSAQRLPDVVYMQNIKSVKLFVQNNQESLPVIKLNSSDLLELHFDDLDAYAKTYYYSFELCNADWSPADLSSFDYIRGFQNQQLTEYRASSISTTKYIHYQALLPDKNCMPSKSGNYLLKVFLDGDESKLAFTKRFYVLENKVGVSAQVMQTFNSQLYNTHQKVQFTINAASLNLFDLQQQLKVTVLQNYRWDNALTNMQPTFNRDNILEYNGEEDVLFPGGKEYRWADLRSFRFQSDRIARIDMNTTPFGLYLRPDAVRTQQPYTQWLDMNGFYEISASEFINPWWQGDYANVHFTFVPNNKQAFDGKDVYISGELTGNNINNDAKMQFNESLDVYEKTLLLKQGYYNYTYVTKDANDTNAKPDVTLTDGNSWETENDYIIFVYYRSLSGRHDQLVAVKIVNSRNVR